MAVSAINIVNCLFLCFQGVENNDGTFLKCSNQFIVLAESKVAGVIGCVYYRFCWFKPKFDRPRINIDALQGTGGTSATKPKSLKTMAERIFLIKNAFSDEV